MDGGGEEMYQLGWVGGVLPVGETTVLDKLQPCERFGYLDRFREQFPEAELRFAYNFTGKAGRKVEPYQILRLNPHTESGEELNEDSCCFRFENSDTFISLKQLVEEGDVDIAKLGFVYTKSHTSHQTGIKTFYDVWIPIFAPRCYHILKVGQVMLPHLSTHKKSPSLKVEQTKKRKRDPQKRSHEEMEEEELLPLDPPIKKQQPNNNTGEQLGQMIKEMMRVVRPPLKEELRQTVLDLLDERDPSPEEARAAWEGAKQEIDLMFNTL
jgi:hypothetical protein